MDGGKAKEKIVYFVRHGQSIDNVAPVYQHKDSPLSPIGEKQADEVALRVSELEFDCLISSPQPRAMQTANAITKATGKAAEYNDLFIERKKPKRINGASVTDEEATKIYIEWNKSLYLSGMKAEDGENFDEITARAERALRYLSDRKEQKIMVVSHGYFIRTILAKVILNNKLTGEIHEQFQKAGIMENTGLTAIKYGTDRDKKEFHWRLWIYNDHSHLSDN